MWPISNTFILCPSEIVNTTSCITENFTTNHKHSAVFSSFPALQVVRKYFLDTKLEFKTS